MANLIDISAQIKSEAISDLRSGIAEAHRKADIVNMRCVRSCPVCGNMFNLASDVTPWPTDTCQNRCAVELERYMDANRDLSVDECIEYMRSAH